MGTSPGFYFGCLYEPTGASPGFYRAASRESSFFAIGRYFIPAYEANTLWMIPNHTTGWKPIPLKRSRTYSNVNNFSLISSMFNR